MTVRPVARVVGGREDVRDDGWGGVAAVIRLDAGQFTEESLYGLDLHVTGLDAVAGTPVLDIKPYLAEFGPRGGLRQPAWSTELMRAYYDGEV
ncbi:TrmO family methyltransferase [Kitasatospora sp. NPDC059146]|uniref:TrmO family methyltransferase domain-containing protein n=1 Tax=unclassified Kitasatospora TaxID=2633591 RepID=UPI0036A6464E